MVQESFQLLNESAALCKTLADAIAELTDDYEYAKRTRDLDTFSSLHFTMQRLQRLWEKADKRYSRRLQMTKVLVAA